LTNYRADILRTQTWWYDK